MNTDIMLKPSGRYIVYLVEEDDDDRERVLSALVNVAEITYETDFDTVTVNDLLESAKVFATQQHASMVLKCVPREDGTLFTIENFNEEEDEE